jgi:hypothetical protein
MLRSRPASWVAPAPPCRPRHHGRGQRAQPKVRMWPCRSRRRGIGLRARSASAHAAGVGGPRIRRHPGGDALRGAATRGSSGAGDAGALGPRRAMARRRLTCRADLGSASVTGNDMRSAHGRSGAPSRQCTSTLRRRDTSPRRPRPCGRGGVSGRAKAASAASRGRADSPPRLIVGMPMAVHSGRSRRVLARSAAAMRRSTTSQSRSRAPGRCARRAARRARRRAYDRWQLTGSAARSPPPRPGLGSSSGSASAHSNR